MRDIPEFPELCRILADANDEHAKAPFEEFSWAITSAHAQFLAGQPHAKIPLTTAFSLGVSGVVAVGKWLQKKTGRKIHFHVEPIAKCIAIVLQGPAPRYSDSELDEEDRENQPMNAQPTKVPRPPNAFIIYRKEWHPVVAGANPDLHNNDISVIIGRKWQEEPENVKRMYKEKAEHLKLQHAIAHPGYQYSPRKPSEKKKRMTRTKRARMNTQSNGNGVVEGSEQLPLPRFSPIETSPNQELKPQFGENAMPTPTSMDPAITPSPDSKMTSMVESYMHYNAAMPTPIGYLASQNPGFATNISPQPDMINFVNQPFANSFDPMSIYNYSSHNRVPMPAEMPFDQPGGLLGIDPALFDDQDVFSDFDQTSPSIWDTNL